MPAMKSRNRQTLNAITSNEKSIKVSRGSPNVSLYKSVGLEPVSGFYHSAAMLRIFRFTSCPVWYTSQRQEVKGSFPQSNTDSNNIMTQILIIVDSFLKNKTGLAVDLL